MYLIKCPLVIPTNSTALSTQHTSGRMLKAKEEREKKKREGCNFLWGKQASSLFNKFIWDFPPKELRRGEPAVIKMS